MRLVSKTALTGWQAELVVQALRRTAAVKEIGDNVTAVRGDVSKLGDLDRLFAQVKREKGRLDVVFANAGTAQLAPLEKITEEHFDVIFGVNVKGVVLV